MRKDNEKGTTIESWLKRTRTLSQALAEEKIEEESIKLNKIGTKKVKTVKVKEIESCEKCKNWVTTKVVNGTKFGHCSEVICL